MRNPARARGLVYLATVVCCGAQTAPTSEPPPQYDLRTHALDYLHQTFGPSAIAASAFSASATSLFSRSRDWGTGGNRYLNHGAANLFAHTTRESIQFGVAALMRQDEQFHPSGQERISRRLMLALHYSFFVSGRDGDEVALPRLAAAVGTGWAMHEYHPWERVGPNPWGQTAVILSRYVLRSFWHEFQPDVKIRLRALRERVHPVQP